MKRSIRDDKPIRKKKTVNPSQSKSLNLMGLWVAPRPKIKKMNKDETFVIL